MVSRKQLKRATTIALFAVLLISMAGVIAVAMDPPSATESYTEFYILGPGGNATDYPRNLSVDESGTVIAGVSNHEHRRTAYRLELRLLNQTAAERELSLDDGETWEEDITFTAREPGRQRLDLLLFREGSAKPYRTTRLWLNVTA